MSLDEFDRPVHPGPRALMAAATARRLTLVLACALYAGCDRIPSAPVEARHAHDAFAATYGHRTVEMRDGRLVRDVGSLGAHRAPPGVLARDAGARPC